MHLQYHLGAHVLLLQTLLYAYHGQFDDVGGTALYGGVDGVTLGISAHYGIVAIDVGQVASALAEGFGITLLACCLYAVRHVLAHSGIGGKVSVDEFLGLCA